MMFQKSRLVCVRMISPQMALLFLLQMFVSQISVAQFLPASPPIADPSDTRFDSMQENLASPALTASTLKPAPPIRGYVADKDGYSVELIQVQWRFGDPIDLYVMKPTGVKSPPVVL